MKLRIDNDILRIYGIGVGLIIIGILFALFVSLHFIFFGVGSLLILMGIMTMVMATYAGAKVKDDLIEDERCVRINEKAGYHAFWILIGSMGIFQLINLLGRLKLNYTDTMPILFIVGVYSWIILRWHYNRKGDLS